jgi:glyoxylase I family protein
MRPFRVAELDHVVLRCADQTRTLDFYVRILGLSEARRVPSLGLVQLRAGRSLVDLVPSPTSGGRAAVGNVEHFCLAVEAEDMAQVAAALHAQGVEVMGDPAARYGAHGMGPSIYVRDPEGNVVELKQLPRG